MAQDLPDDRWLAVGRSNASEAGAAGREAAPAALVRDDARLLIVFCSHRHDLHALLAAIEAVGGGAPLIGCTTAGEIATGGPGDAGVVVVALGGSGFTVRTEQGLIVAIGRWVLREASRQAAEWHRRWPQLRVGVNVSGRQLLEPSLVADIEGALADSGMTPECLVLELTETILMRDVEETAARLHEIRRLGPEISIDDFGTGYSSLQYLLRFPIDSLKVARSFVDGLDLGGDPGLPARPADAGRRAHDAAGSGAGPGRVACAM